MVTHTPPHAWARPLCAVLALALAGCDCGGAPPGAATCRSAADCPLGPCIDRRCVLLDAGVAPDRGGRPPRDADPGGADDAVPAVPCDSGIVCGAACCAPGHRCAHGACVADLGPCTGNDDCDGDSYCDPSLRCTPYGTPPETTNDPSCSRPIEVGSFLPAEQCRWTGPGAGDPFPGPNVYSAPLVADFNLDDDAAVLAPSIVFSGFASSAAAGGVLTVIDGRTCAEVARATAPADRLIYASNFAIGDLDLAPDGRPEIVGVGLEGSAAGVIAFGWTGGALVRRWVGRTCDGAGEPRHLPSYFAANVGPSMHDLDDDGRPEVLLGRLVYDASGCWLNTAETYSDHLGLGVFAVVADVDNDGLPELVDPDGVFTWDIVGRRWVLEPYFVPPAATRDDATRDGYVAVADVGEFPGAVGDAPGRPEIVVVSAPSANANQSETGAVRVMTIGGQIVFGPFAIPNEPGLVAGRGGPPTVGDFDGDGRREIGVAGASRYSVYDLDCDVDAMSAPGCARATTLPRGVLWSRRSQDLSSNVTGSSVFDFDADGVAEVVYGDECFLRIYRGTDGEVLFSQSASSGTGYELPVIADVDGDFNSEIVVAMTAGTSCPATDPIYTRGVSSYRETPGIVVLRDAEDRWAASRPIWNQHAYSVSNVSDTGIVPRTSQWMRNHSDATLNNFRMNAQGTLERRGLADLTVALARVSDLCSAMSGAVTLTARVCDRGTNPVPDGARVVFYDGDPDRGAPVACETRLPRLLGVGECVEVSCPWTLPAGGGARDVTVVVDPDDLVFECRDANNRGVIAGVLCDVLG